jgi:transposase InsO family protein
MRLFGIKAYRRRGRKPKKSGIAKQSYPNLLKTTLPTRPHHIWAADFTYIPYQEGFLYLATVMDLFTREIVGMAVQTNHAVSLTLQALFSAVEHHTRPIITSSQFLAHQQAVNAVLIQSRFRDLPSGLSCERWTTFREPLSPSVPLMPDGYLELMRDSAVHPMFLEVDLGTESSRVWKRKVELYLKFALGAEFESMFHQKRFRVLVVLHSERRMEAIRKTVAKRTEKLFWFSTQDDVSRHGLCSSIWLRPTGAERIPLL